MAPVQNIPSDSTKLTASALTKHNAYQSANCPQRYKDDAMPSGIRCLFLSRATSNPETTKARHKALATSQIKAFEKAFHIDSHKDGD